MAQLCPPPDLRPYFIALEELPSPLDPQSLFQKEAPLELDIGCGRGLFLYNTSLKFPERNFLGLEIDYKEGRRGAARLKKLAQPNARVIGGDANKALKDYFPAGSVEKIHVYFPDPWWKKKHHKRRLVTPQFLELVLNILTPEGEFHLWTDVTDYWEMALETITPFPQFTACPPPQERDPTHDMDYQTSFERKKRLAGWPVYRGLWQKKA